MDFRLTEEQLLLRQAARDFVRNECPVDFVRRMEADPKGYTAELWVKMAELGWMGLMVPAEHGGIGWSVLDLVILMEEMGAGCVPGPFLSTVLCGTILAAGARAGLQADLLPRLAAGKLILTLAYLEAGSRKYEPALVETTAEPAGDAFVLSGTKLFVPEGHVADAFVVTARTSGERLDQQGITLLLVPAKSAGIARRQLTTVAGDKQFEVAFQGVRVPMDQVIGTVGEGFPLLDRALEIGALAKCGEMVGGAGRVLEMTVAYAKERVQFGKAIGSFQAVQHHCANMAIHCSSSRFITYKAAWKMSEDLPCDLIVAAAKAWVSDAYKRVVACGHQIGAATAYIVEHDMTLYSRRAKAAELAFGDAAYHRGRAASAMGL